MTIARHSRRVAACAALAAAASLALAVPASAATTWYGTDSMDYHDGGPDNDTMYGYGDHDLLWGHGGADSLYGGYGADQLYGNSGADYLDGGPGGDYLVGGDGNDTIRVNLDFGNDTWSCGEGVDVVYIHGGSPRSGLGCEVYRTW